MDYRKENLNYEILPCISNRSLNKILPFIWCISLIKLQRSPVLVYTECFGQVFCLDRLWSACAVLVLEEAVRHSCFLLVSYRRLEWNAVHQATSVWPLLWPQWLHVQINYFRRKFLEQCNVKILSHHVLSQVVALILVARAPGVVNIIMNTFNLTTINHWYTVT